MTPRPQEPHLLAYAAVSSLVLAHDADAQSVAPNYWKWAADAHSAMGTALLDSEEPGIRAQASIIAANPRDDGACRQLVKELERVFAESADTPASARLVELAQEVESSSRLLTHFGSPTGYETPAPTADVLLGSIVRRPHHGTHPVDAAVVIPFRAAQNARDRVRNLAAVLNALADQSHPRDRYRVIVVESDAQAQWRELFADACDQYVFAPSPGPFNKSWAVNVGVVHGASPAELICVLDGDILVDHHFIERAVERFGHCGTQAHWPYRDMLFLDEHASARASTRRCLDGASQVDSEDLRGVWLRRPPGGCVWLRQSLFQRLAGMDERFVGWGGEDEDFVWRVERHGVMDRHDDPLVHLHHSRAPHKAEGDVPFYDKVEDLAFCTWPFDAEIGRLDRYVK